MMLGYFDRTVSTTDERFSDSTGTVTKTNPPSAFFQIALLRKSLLEITAGICFLM
jgi:hypothetical protein